MSEISYKNIRKEVKIVTDSGSTFYINIDYDSEFNNWTASLGLISHSTSAHDALNDLVRQCKELSYIDELQNIDNLEPK